MSKSGTDIAYQYNADGLRTKKTVTQSGASTVYEYLWNESKLVGQKVGSDAVRILYDANDEPVGFTVNDTASYYYVKNLQGDVLAIVDKTGAEKVSYVYDAWGQIVTATGDAALQKLNPCTYRGYYYDAETGLYYLQSRYYNPEWGRFINADSNFDINTGILNANIFTYCANNPIIHADVNGESVTLVVLGVTLVLSNAQAIALAFMSAIGAIALFWRLFPRQYRNFINGIGGLVGTLGSAISQVFQLIRTKAIAIGNSLSNTVSKARTKIRNESKRFEYWIAIKLNLGRGATYFPSKGISYSFAISFVRKGGDVFAKNASKARQLAQAVGNGRKPASDPPHGGMGYFRHYHATSSRGRIGGHVFYV